MDCGRFYQLGITEAFRGTRKLSGNSIQDGTGERRRMPRGAA